MKAFLRAALAVALSVASSLPIPARAAGAAPELVLVGEPSRSESLDAASGPVTLSYRVIEIFAGEPGSASVVVRHDDLAAEDRARLRDGDRVILLASRDAASPGRFIAPAPLRATPSAVAAFRKWSAPADVRAPRPVEAVVAEVLRDQSGAPAASPAKAVPATPPVARVEPAPVARVEPTALEPAAEAEPVVRFEPAAPSVPAARPEIEEESLAPRREVVVQPLPVEVVEPAEEREEPVPVARVADGSWEPPLLIDPALQPEPGPGLPDAPPSTPLGPKVERRTDLRPPPRGRR